MRTVYACVSCGWEWPLPYEPSDYAECGSCGNELVKVDPHFVAIIEMLEQGTPSKLTE